MGWLIGRILVESFNHKTFATVLYTLIQKLFDLLKTFYVKIGGQVQLASDFFKILMQ